MLSTRRRQTSAGLLLALALFAGGASAQSKKDRRTAGPSRPPTVAVEADTQVVTVCPESEATATTQVRLTARANSPDGNPLRYRWTASGGRIVGDGPEVTWDLKDARPGTYTARIDVESGPAGDPLCNAFTTVPVVVRACPPPRRFCPNISIYCPDTVAAGQPVTFSASATGGTAGVTPSYRWTVSRGTITGGQGTTSINVDTAGLGGQVVTAKVEVVGYELDCNASCTAQVPRPPQSVPFDEFGNVARDDEKARLDNFAIQLQNDPASRGYVVVYPGRESRQNEAQRRVDRAREYLVGTRGIEAGRIITLVGPRRDAFTVQLWVVPAGADPPSIR